MIFGVLKDIKEGENRVICTPAEVASLTAAGRAVPGSVRRTFWALPTASWIRPPCHRYPQQQLHHLLQVS